MYMKDITILDNFINDEELEKARQFIGEDDQQWHFNPVDNAYKKAIVDLRLVWDRTFDMENLIPSAKNFILKIKNRIDKCTNTNFKLERVYLNRQVCGQDVTLHKDGNKPNVYTLLIYIGDITPENYDKAGGDLELKTKEITRIEPFTKRAVLFKGYIPHKAYAPLVQDLTRISIAFKFIDTSNELPFSVNYS